MTARPDPTLEFPPGSDTSDGAGDDLGDEDEDPEVDLARSVEAVRRREPLRPLAIARELALRASADASGLGPVGDLLLDPSITEILINGPGRIWVERGGRLAPTSRSIDRYGVDLLIERILHPLGLRADRLTPIVDARLTDGSRCHVVLPPLAVDGPAVSIRRFGHRALPLTAFGPAGMVGVLERLMAVRANILVVGPTSSGKTTLVNCLSGRFDRDERVVCIEDTAELRLAGRQVVRLEARPANSEGVGEVTMRRLVTAAMRMRPDRLVIGEVRGAEAFDLLLALSSGHRGSIATCHGGDAASGLERLSALAALASIDVGPEVVTRLVRQAFDVVIEVDRIGGRRAVRAIVATGSIDTVGPGRRLWPHAPRPRPVSPTFLGDATSIGGSTS